jgi:hypothetical protein
MYDFAVQFSPEGLKHVCELSFFELTCFNFFIKAHAKSDLYDFNLFHFNVRVLIIS